MKAEYQPIKRGMTEAVTRGELEAAEREGREPVANVKQLTWFDVKDESCNLYGVLDGVVYSWYEDGRSFKHRDHEHDLFAPPRYEWQWNTISPNGIYYATTVHFQTAEEAAVGLDNGWCVERIEGSKRLVKE